MTRFILIITAVLVGILSLLASVFLLRNPERAKTIFAALRGMGTLVGTLRGGGGGGGGRYPPYYPPPYPPVPYPSMAPVVGRAVAPPSLGTVEPKAAASAVVTKPVEPPAVKQTATQQAEATPSAVRVGLRVANPKTSYQV